MQQKWLHLTDSALVIDKSQKTFANLRRLGGRIRQTGEGRPVRTALIRSLLFLFYQAGHNWYASFFVVYSQAGQRVRWFGGLTAGFAFRGSRWGCVSKIYGLYGRSTLFLLTHSGEDLNMALCDMTYCAIMNRRQMQNR